MARFQIPISSMSVFLFWEQDIECFEETSMLTEFFGPLCLPTEKYLRADYYDYGINICIPMDELISRLIPLRTEVKF